MSAMNLIESDAVFSEDPGRRYRYVLWRTWHQGRRTLVFIMLNPSTADEETNDPTVERCQRRAAALDYGGLVVLNIFALRATDPGILYRAKDPVGPQNDEWILGAARSDRDIVCAWGAHGALGGRGTAVRKLLAAASPRSIYHLGMTKEGHPRHPLYVSYSQPLVPWNTV